MYHAVTAFGKSQPQPDVGNSQPASDFLIVDISLKDNDGIVLVRENRKDFLDMPMLVLSMFDESLYAERSLLAGARGYL